MTAETDLLPLPNVWKYDGFGKISAQFTADHMRAYARANVAELQREVEGLRAEVELLRMGVCGDACLHIAIERDQLKARAALDQETTNG